VTSIQNSAADGTRQGGRQGAEMGGIARRALLVVLAADHQERVAEIADLRELQVQREKQAGAHQQVDEPGRSPDVAVDRCEKIVQCMHVNPSRAGPS
jgi:hypothetical protein